MCRYAWFMFILLFFFFAQIEKGESVDELERMDPLYTNNSVKELLVVCKDLRNEELIFVPGKKSRQCPNGTTCINFCNEDRLDKLRDAQDRVINMLRTLKAVQRVLMHFISFFLVIVLGTYLIVVKQFDWRTLPCVGHEFQHDPTDGYRYSHYTWMKWIILDSEHPTYYMGMTPDAHELEYIPQHNEWSDPDASSEIEIHPVWSVNDIYSLTTDPHERLEFYFLRVQTQCQLDHKQPLLLKLYNQLREEEKEKKVEVPPKVEVKGK